MARAALSRNGGLVATLPSAKGDVNAVCVGAFGIADVDGLRCLTIRPRLVHAYATEPPLPAKLAPALRPGTDGSSATVTAAFVLAWIWWSLHAAQLAVLAGARVELRRVALSAAARTASAASTRHPS